MNDIDKDKRYIDLSLDVRAECSKQVYEHIETLQNQIHKLQTNRVTIFLGTFLGTLLLVEILSLIR